MRPRRRSPWRSQPPRHRASRRRGAHRRRPPPPAHSRRRPWRSRRPRRSPRPLRRPPPRPPPRPPRPRRAPTAKPSAPRFAATVHPVLMSACAICHRPGAPAAMTRLVLSGDAAHDEAIVRPFVDAQAPQQSLLVTKSAGQMHAGGAVLPPGDPRLEAIVAWAKGLAAAEAPAPATEAAAASAPSADGAGGRVRRRRPLPPADTPRPGPHGHGGPGGPGLGLPVRVHAQRPLRPRLRAPAVLRRSVRDGERERAPQLPPLPLPVARQRPPIRAACRSRSSPCSSGRPTAASPGCPRRSG